ncbi:MAG: SpoIIE family protein phosphatase [Clostridia bacterium]|nr:SpoIIE family protein phosphatase [Clostridia bacterium]
MKQKLMSLRVRILLPVIAMTLFVVILLTILFSRAFISMILRQQNEVNAVGFDTVIQTIPPLIRTSISEVRHMMADERVASYARFDYDSLAEMLHGRKDCRDYLRSEIMRYDSIYGVLVMRTDGSLFGVLPDGNLFYDRPEENPLPEDMKTQILNAPHGQTVWAGPLEGSVIYGFENEKMPRSLMIAAWKSVSVNYGECYAMMLMDEAVFDGLFAALQDEQSSWHLFTADRTEIYHTGGNACGNAEQLISGSNSGTVFRDEDGLPVCTFSVKMDSPSWTVVRKVSMESYEKVVSSVRGTVAVFGAAVLLFTLAAYLLWLKRFMRQYDSLQNGIIRIGQGDLESETFEPTSIAEFKQMQREINRTRLALTEQMDTIRRMEREQAEQEHRKKEQERIAQELSMAREIQANTLPSIFPPFPDRKAFSLYASMTPAKEVGGDFYDFFLIDNDHLALVIADVSGKGIPAALFMMVSKTLIQNQLMTGCDPATALERVNRQLCERNSSQMFVTVWVAVLDLITGKALVCNAGHEHPAVRRAGGDFELLKYKHGILVGISKKAKYQNREFELHPGDCLFVYTDGVPEANDGNMAMFGEERLLAALNACPDGSPEEILRKVKNAVDTFVGDAEQFDDLTMMCLQYRGAQAENS